MHYDPNKTYTAAARVSGEVRNKLLRLCVAEGRMVSESEMIRLLIQRAEEPRRKPVRRPRHEAHLAA